MRVLLAEDDLIIRMDLAEHLAVAGFDVSEASNGTDACVLAGRPDPMDLLVTDLHMLGADGITVATTACEHHPGLPVLFITGRTDLLIPERMPCPFSFLRKPFTPVDFLATVERICAARSGGAVPQR